METITLQYDTSIPGLKGLMASLVKLEGVTKLESKKASDRSDDYAKEIVRRAAGVKNGKIKTRPIEKLLEEA